MKRTCLVGLLILWGAVSWGISRKTKSSFLLTSPAFANKAEMPKLFTGDGENVSPPLKWAGVPSGAKSLALIVEDPDAPQDAPWVHWVFYGLAAFVPGLVQGVSIDPELKLGTTSLKQGRNSFGRIGYLGPAPSAGKAHHYLFKLYALNTDLKLAPGVSGAELKEAIKTHVLGQTTLTATYHR